MPPRKLQPSEIEARLQELQVSLEPVARLKGYGQNARTHSKKQIGQIKASIAAFGFVSPILIDEGGELLAGHGRLAAAQSLGLATVPCVRLAGLSAHQKRAFRIADNKLAEKAGWDLPMLVAEVQLVLDAGEIELPALGLEIPELELMLADVAAPEEPGDPRDDRLPAISRAPVSRVGDLFVLGRHRLYCGDATEAASFAALMGDEPAQMAFCDPPYNVRIAGHARSRRSGHREFVMASGEMSSEAFVEFQRKAYALLAAHSVEGSIHFICMDWRHLQEAQAAGRAVYSELKNICVWVKDNGGMGTFYRSRHEMVLVFKAGRASHINAFELGQHGRYRTNVWEYRGANSRKPGRAEELALHPTVKPVAMVADAIKDVSEPGGVVLDCFGGSGTTLIAAHKTGRRARLMELDPIYVDRIIRRWEAHAKDEAIHAGTGARFAELAERRRHEQEVQP